MKALTLRNIDIKTAEMLKNEASESGMSVNSWLLQKIDEILGIKKNKRNTVYHDLDKLAGTWSEKEFAEFEKETESSSMIDEEMWK